MSVKDAKDSGGSFGIGKHAAFAATDLRTVLYSTAYHTNGGGSQVRRRFTGKSILVSHEDNGQPFRASGWLEANGGPLCEEEIPKEFQLESPGTKIDILGFNNSDIMKWESEARQSLVTHFFHAFVHDNLRVCVGDHVIDKT